jgi:hypothetical protein
MKWIKVTESLPPDDVEVLVWIDGHRGPSYSNSYARVAYRWNGKWWMYGDREPMVGVVLWAKYTKPNKALYE